MSVNAQKNFDKNSDSTFPSMEDYSTANVYDKSTNKGNTSNQPEVNVAKIKQDGNILEEFVLGLTDIEKDECSCDTQSKGAQIIESSKHYKTLNVFTYLVFLL